MELALQRRTYSLKDPKIQKHSRTMTGNGILYVFFRGRSS